MRGIDINKAPLDEMETVFGKNLLAVVCDVANWREVIDTFEQFPPIDILVYCAGIMGQTNLKSDETDPCRRGTRIPD